MKSAKHVSTTTTNKDNNDSTDPPATVRPAPALPVESRSLFDAVAADLASVSDDDSVIITVDINLAVGTVRAAVEKIGTMRGAIVAALPTFPVEDLDRLPARMDALVAANELYTTASATPPEREDLPAAVTLRDNMLRHGQSLVDFGLLPAAAIAAVTVNRSYADVGADLTRLSTAFGDHWATLAGHTVLTAEQVNEARALGRHLGLFVAHREDAIAARTQAITLRRRLYILFARSYDEVRSAIAYFRRHEGDADEIAPSFHNRPGNVTRFQTPPDEPAPAAPVAPVVATPVAAAAPSTPPVAAPSSAPVASLHAHSVLKPEDNPLEDP